MRYASGILAAVGGAAARKLKLDVLRGTVVCASGSYSRRTSDTYILTRLGCSPFAPQRRGRDSDLLTPDTTDISLHLILM